MLRNIGKQSSNQISPKSLCSLLPCLYENLIKIGLLTLDIYFYECVWTEYNDDGRGHRKIAILMLQLSDRLR